MPPRVPRGTGQASRLVGGGVLITNEFSPESRNIVERIPQMREQALRNIGRLSVGLAARMQEHAREHYEWQDQPSDIHNPNRGYPNDSASAQIVGRAFVDFGADTVAIAMSHPTETVQERPARDIYYGEILELGHQGRYAILSQTIQRFTDDLLALMAAHAMDDMGYRGAGRQRRSRTVRV